MRGFIVALIALYSSVVYAKSVSLNQIQSVDIHIFDGKVHHQDATRSKFVMNVYINGKADHNHVATFIVSPGALYNNPKPGKEPELTPEGVFHPQRLEKDYVSKQFGGKALGIFETGKMPNSIFFYNGFAMHGSKSTVDGKPASKGCVRLKVKDSKKLFKWVSAALKNNQGNVKAVTIYIDDTESDYVARYRRKNDPSSKGKSDR